MLNFHCSSNDILMRNYLNAGIFTST
uniref:Uncharacterized protein n=1 Tax=Anguilla anguilla TaxID=7936 RepID=A0A0E9TNH1_ANGAN